MSDVNKAKSWELGTVRKKDGKLYIVLGPDVELTVKGRPVVVDPKFRTLKALQEDEMVERDKALIDRNFKTEEVAQKQAEYREKGSVKGTIIGYFQEQN